jgi:hypothetical protein
MTTHFWVFFKPPLVRSSLAPAGLSQIVALRWLYGRYSCGHKRSCLRRQGPKLNLVFLSDPHSLDLFKGQPVSGSIINPGGRRTGMAGDLLRNLDGAARIHVLGNPRRSEAVTTNSLQDPAGLRPFLNQLQDTPTIQAGAKRLDSLRPSLPPTEDLIFGLACSK